ncbi:MAG: FadR family transcriptional regulator [Kordiimonadaceae bacterium]|nr:FadR family transcriptional regulator [Kordiimonadaceae bacterium]
MAVSAPSLTQQIANEIGSAIVRSEYDETNPFPIEADLCQQFGVSRSILREAVKMLTSKGLLKARPRQGTWVQPEENWNLLDPDVLRWLLERKFSINLLAEFTEIRMAMEPQAAAFAARRATDDQKQYIANALERMRAAEMGHDDALAADIAFHVAVLEASGNRFFMQLKDMVETALTISIRVTNKTAGVETGSIANHRAIYDAICDGDAVGARTTSMSLIQEAYDLILEAGETAE